MTVTYNQYIEDFKNFLNNHRCDFKVKTSMMKPDGTWHKDYLFEDGALFSEVMMPVYEEYEVEVRGYKVKGQVKMLRTEYYSTETPSKYYYEKY